jgi:hypothetical protein
MRYSGAKLGNYLRMKHRRRLANSHRWLSRPLRKMLHLHNRFSLNSSATQKNESP